MGAQASRRAPRARVLAEVPPHVEYALTPLGMTLTEPLTAICRWAMDHLGEVQAARTASDARGG